MTPHTKLKVANALMLLGAVFIPLAFLHFLGTLSSAPDQMSLLGEGLLNIGGAFALALVVGLGGFIWSMRVEKRHPSAEVSGTFAIRILVFMVVFIPLVVGSF